MKENKLIAEFMGLTNHHNDNLVMVRKVSQGNEPPINEVVPIDALQYHSSWDWLMPVVEKIETVSGKLPTHIGNIPNDEDYESNNFLSTNIEETYKAVVEFIKNQNN